MTDMTGGGAGAAEAYSQIQDRGLRLFQLQQEGQYRTQELGMRAQEIMHQNAVLMHQTAQQQYAAFHQIGEDWRKLLPTYVQNHPEAIFDPNKPQTPPVINNLMTPATQEPGSFTNAYRGSFQPNPSHLTHPYPP